MAARIFTYLVVTSPGQPERVVLWDTLDISVGRVPGQDVVLEDPEVSRAHALFVIEQERYTVADQGTANGTFVNGVRVSTHALRPGDEVQLGQTCIVFRQESESPMGRGSRAEFASQLKGFEVPGAAAGEGGRTILGMAPGAEVDGMGDEFAELGPVGEAQFEIGAEPTVPPAAVARDLDPELASGGGAAWEDSALGMEPLQPPPKPEPAPAPAPAAPPARGPALTPTRPARAAARPAQPAASAESLPEVEVESEPVARLSVVLEIAGPKGPLLSVVKALLDREIAIPPFKLRLRKRS